MAVGLTKVRAREPLRIPAAAYNAFIEAAIDHQQRQRSVRGGSDTREQLSTSILPIRNETGLDLPRFAVLGIAGPIITRTASADTFKQKVTLRGVAPTADHAGRFAILLSPLIAGEIGQACIDGVCIAKVEVAAESHGFAEIAAGQTTMLRSAASGSAVLVWREPVEEREASGIAWAVVRIGGGGGGSASPATSYAQILSAAGTSPPYIYTAQQVFPTAGGFSAPSGPDFDLENVAERGTNGSGVHALPAGSIVMYWTDPATGRCFCESSFYRGTY